mmetsp:Transcript_1596/g.3284  ORF Transcript_1596/g.3284 Transcript_1596/m.3284 type:complete len:113 (+) Transcript_1596:1206-1544(+)
MIAKTFLKSDLSYPRVAYERVVTVSVLKTLEHAGHDPSEQTALEPAFLAVAIIAERAMSAGGSEQLAVVAVARAWIDDSSMEPYLGLEREPLVAEAAAPYCVVTCPSLMALF